MISCIDIAYQEMVQPGSHDCVLPAAYYQKIHWKCGWADNCWAFELVFESGNSKVICFVRDMQIHIDGKLLPIKIESLPPHEWRLSLKDVPESDAIVHWAIETCQ